MSGVGINSVRCQGRWALYYSMAKHQWLLLQFIVLLKMDAKGVRNM